jgi:hypothetical protein
MSLKSFHVIFIFLASLVCLVLGGMMGFSEMAAGASLKLAAVLSGTVGIGLAIYGVWFIKKKSKTIII